MFLTTGFFQNSFGGWTSSTLLFLTTGCFQTLFRGRTATRAFNLARFFQIFFWGSFGRRTSTTTYILTRCFQNTFWRSFGGEDCQHYLYFHRLFSYPL